MLSFNTLREANKQRLPQFKNALGEPAHSEPDGSDWTRSDWLEALVGELGEYANFSKKFRRGDITEEEFMMHARKEIADVQIYLDHLAKILDIDLGQATVEKFNEVSKRVGSYVFIDDNHIVKCHPDMFNRIIRTGQGPSALMQIKTRSGNRYYGDHCMGGSCGVDIGKIFGLNPEDLDMWEKHNPTP